jgi:ribonuclease P protein component
VGLIVSRGSGNAVARNRIKRRIRPLIGRMNLQPGMDYVIIANSGVFDTPHPRLAEWLESAVGES